MTNVDQRIKAVLGKGAEAFAYSAAEVKRTGWRAFVPAPQEGVEGTTAAAIVEKHWREFRELNVRLFAGGRVTKARDGEAADASGPEFDELYALPQLPTLDVLEVTQTGPDDSRPHDPSWRRVRARLSPLMAACPFEILAADGSFLEAAFLRPPVPDEAAKVARIVAEVAPDALPLYSDALADRGLDVPTVEGLGTADDEAAAAAYVRVVGRIMLFWG